MPATESAFSIRTSAPASAAWSARPTATAPTLFLCSKSGETAFSTMGKPIDAAAIATSPRPTMCRSGKGTPAASSAALEDHSSRMRDGPSATTAPGSPISPAVRAACRWLWRTTAAIAATPSSSPCSAATPFSLQIRWVFSEMWSGIVVTSAEATPVSLAARTHAFRLGEPSGPSPPSEFITPMS